MSTGVGQQLLIGTFVVVAAGGAILYGGETGIGALYLLCFTICGGLLAYHFPISTLIAWVVIWLYGRQLLASINVAGGVDARPTDPILLAMGVALIYAFLQGDRRTKHAFLSWCLMLCVFLGWVGLQIITSVPKYGLVSALGEFRSSFRVLLVLPYVIVFVRTRDQQRRLFTSLIWLSVLFIVMAIMNGMFWHTGDGSKATRWMIAQVNLALVLSTAAWYTVRRTGFWVGATNVYAIVLLASMALVVFCAHRSVWAATAAIVCCLALSRLISIKDVFYFTAVLVTAGVTLDFLMADIDLIEFVRERLTAFTSYTEDATANWRAQVWAAAIEQIKGHPITGKGLGNYFYFSLGGEKVVTNIPHNVYVQIGLQVGLVGLALYLGMVAHLIRLLHRAYRRAEDVHTYTLTLYGIIALIGGSVFYVAYGFDPFTWLFVGAGMAAGLTQSANFQEDEVK